MKAIIVTGDKYPCGDAGALRSHAFARLFLHLGYDVTVLGYGEPSRGKALCFEGVEYMSFRPDSENRAIRAAYRCLFGRRALRRIRAKHSDADVIMVVSLFPGDMKRIERFAMANGKVLIHDSVEWYSPEEFRNGERSIAYRNNQQINTEVIRHGWRVVAISRYLEEHFRGRCDGVVRIPVIMDVQSIPFRPHGEETFPGIRFAYAGIPGKKDYLAELIRGFSLLNAWERERVEFHVIGADLQHLYSVCGVDEDDVSVLGPVLKVHGKMPHEEAVQWVMNCDYTMLLRDESLRYAKAGFPTKIVESLAHGTPPVCNISSDLGDYLADGENAFIIPGHTARDVAGTLSRIIAVHGSRCAYMRQNARETAERIFDLRLYAEQMRKILM